MRCVKPLIITRDFIDAMMLTFRECITIRVRHMALTSLEAHNLCMVLCQHSLHTQAKALVANEKRGRLLADLGDGTCLVAIAKQVRDACLLSSFDVHAYAC